jgi:hypothetical protein
MKFKVVLKRGKNMENTQGLRDSQTSKDIVLMEENVA